MVFRSCRYSVRSSFIVASAAVILGISLSHHSLFDNSRFNVVAYTFLFFLVPFYSVKDFFLIFRDAVHAASLCHGVTHMRA